MPLGTTGFVGDRLAEAREARGLTNASLAELLGVSTTAISQYEHNKVSPRPEVMSSIADKLNLPLSFFLRPVASEQEESTLFWRSMSSATKSARTKAKRRFEWLKDIVAYLRQYLDFPEVHLPAFNLPENIFALGGPAIDELAKECRQFWNIGDGPIADIVLFLESNGIIVSRGKLEAEKLDAFSEWRIIDSTPYVFLSSDKSSAARSRLDAAHELAHLILHRNVNPRLLSSAKAHARIEWQAFRFGSAFLLPESSFAQELWSPTLDAFRSLKERWKVSIGAMIKRCEELEIIDEHEARRMWMNYGRRGWRTEEPLDDRLPVEKPRLLSRSIELLVKERVKSREQILLDLPYAQTDIEELTGLPRGYLTGIGEVVPKLREPKIAEVMNGTGKVVSFTEWQSEN
ncbi:MAG TPA: XRE family transcriptional regulator [Pyrinomonadaceae bacterium]|jgi:Zn-dependent peptidase ImmA (M78 family)/DNA-binding XRE family transcriptional regulator|nr:XRE family transcriptional regulator [Pyrinomonadaceae bacterium]